MRNVSLLKGMAILSVMALPLLFFQAHKNPAAYANTSKSIALKRATSSGKMESTVNVPVLNVRKDSNLSSQVVNQLKLGTKVTVQREQAGWAQVVSSSGEQGWVYKNYISKNVPSSRQEPLIGKTIVLDPGHGGSDDGTTSVAGTPEKNMTLPTAKFVEQKLKNAGANVILTRTSDAYIPLGQRTIISNRHHADAFISFHYNWSDDRSINGLTDFYYHKSRDNILASNILTEICKTTGLKNDGSKFDNLEVLRNNSQPSTLIELGFLSNKRDDSVAESTAFYDHVAEGVYKGLLDYFQSKNS
jgi:N-acetylmuramoyl-L-alanine amidase